MDRAEKNKKQLKLASNTPNKSCSAQTKLLDMPIEILAKILTHTNDRFAACQTCLILSYVIHDIVGYHSIHITTEEQAKQVVKHKGIIKHTKINLVSDENGFPSDKILEKFAGVHTIYLQCSRVTDEGIKSLAGVHTIDLLGNRTVTDEGIKSLAGVHSIELYSTNVTDEGVKALKGVHKISLSTGVTDEGLKALAGVHTIVLWRTPDNVTDKGIKALKDVHEIRLASPKKDWFKHLCNIHSVVLAYASHLTDDDLQALTNVKCLEIYICPNITDLAFETLVNLEQLKLIGLGNITNGCLKYLKSLKRLISMGYSVITKDAVESMGIQYVKLNKYKIPYRFQERFSS